MATTASQVSMPAKPSMLKSLCSIPRLSVLAPLILWLLLAAVQCLVYAIVVPPWQGPDEPRHFEIAMLFSQLGHMPTKADLSDELQARILDSMWQHDFFRLGWVKADVQPTPATTHHFDDIWPSPAHELNQPGAYYFLSSLELKLLPWSWGDDPAYQAMWLRLWCIPYELIMVWLAWLAARQMFPIQAVSARDNSLATFMRAAVPAFVALLPMQVFVNSVVNNDGLVIAASGAVFVLTLRTECRQRLGWELPVAVLMAGLAIWAKRTALLVVLLLAWMLISAALRWSKRWLKQRRLDSRLAYGVLASSFGCGAVLALIALKSNGNTESLLARYFHLPVEFQELWDSGAYTRSIFHTPYFYYMKILFESFWGRFGWLNVSLPPLGYTILQGMTLLIVLAAVTAVAGLKLKKLQLSTLNIQLSSVSWGALLLCGFAPVATLLIVLAKEVLFLSYVVGVVPQGRYLFPALIPIAVVFCLGIYTWGRALGPGRLLATWLALLLLFDGICLFGYVLPFYHVI